MTPLNNPFTADPDFLFPFPLSYEAPLKSKLESDYALQLLSGSLDPVQKHKTFVFGWLFITALVQPEMAAMLVAVAPYKQFKMCSNKAFCSFQHTLSLEELIYLKRESAPVILSIIQASNKIKAIEDFLQTNPTSKDYGLVPILQPYFSQYKIYLQNIASKAVMDTDSWKPATVKNATQYLVELTTSNKYFTKGSKVVLTHPIPGTPYKYNLTTDMLTSGSVVCSCNVKYKVLSPAINIEPVSLETLHQHLEAVKKLPTYIAGPFYDAIAIFLGQITDVNTIVSLFLKQDPTAFQSSYKVYLGRTKTKIPYLIRTIAATKLLDVDEAKTAFKIRLLSLVPFIKPEREVLNIDAVVQDGDPALTFASASASQNSQYWLNIAESTQQLPDFSKLSLVFSKVTPT